MDKYNKIIRYLPKDWKVSIQSGKRFQGSDIGCCNYDKKEIWLKNTRCEIKLTEVLAHEIAHALCPEQGHNKVWQKEYISLLYE